MSNERDNFDDQKEIVEALCIAMAVSILFAIGWELYEWIK